MRTANDVELRRAQGVARRVAEQHMRGQAWEGVGVEDVVQEVLLRFAQLDLESIANADAWVTTATRNRCLDVRHAARRHDQRHLDAGSNPDQVIVDDVRTITMAVVGPSARAISPMVLAHALEGLSGQERAMLLKHGEGWSNAEIAEAFGYASAQSAAVAITRAKAKVRARFDTAHQRRELVEPQRVY